MNNFAVALIVLIAGVNALPNDLTKGLRNTILNKDDVIDLINDSIEAIKDNGLDPYRNEGDEFSFAIDYPFPGFLSVNGFFENFLFTGLSNIVINSVGYDDDKITLDLSLPRLEATIDKLLFDVIYGDIATSFDLSGRLAVNDLRIVAEVKKTSYESVIDDLNILAWFRTIDSNLDLKINNNDFSSSLNDFLENTIPEIISLHQDELNQKISELILSIINGAY